MATSSLEGLHLLSNVAVEVINDTKKENDRMSLIINNNKDNKDSSSDGWDVFRFQISEEHRINKVFINAEEFLHHWLVELNGRKENSRLRPLFMNDKKKRHKKTQACSKGIEGFRQEAVARYKQLTYTQRALYRAIAKEYFRKK